MANDPKSPPPFGPVLGRRMFMKLAGASAAGSAISGCNPFSELFDSSDARVSQGTNAWHITVLRPQDLLALRFEFTGLDTNHGQLFKTGSGPHHIVVKFPSQSLLEAAKEEAQLLVAPTNPVMALLGGPSRLAFEVPASFTSTTWSLPALLELIEQSSLVVSPWAKPPPEQGSVPFAVGGIAPLPYGSSSSSLGLEGLGAARRSQRASDFFRMSGTELAGSTNGVVGPQETPPILGTTPIGPAPEPGARETALELPFGLIISPHSGAGFAHQSSVAGGQGEWRQELWHSRMGIRTANGIDERARYERTVRALNARDGSLPPLPPPQSGTAGFMWPLSQFDRQQFVKNSSEFESATDERNPIHVERLMLTTLGGYLRSRAVWPGEDVEGWDHDATLGRDHFVRVVYKGYLYPYGVEARLIKITERKVVNGKAVLFQRGFIRIVQPTVSFSIDDMEVPFEAVTFTELETPDVDLQGFEDNQDEGNSPNCIAIRYKKATPSSPTPTPAYLFPVDLLDRDGHTHAAEVPAVFVPSKRKFDTETATNNNDPNGQAAQLLEGLPKIHLSTRFGFAPSKDPDDGVFETQAMRLKAVPTESLFAPVRFAPGLRWAEIESEGLRALAGDQVVTKVKYADVYLNGNNGYDPANNPWEVALELFDGEAPQDFSFSGNSQKSGGFIQPGMSIKGISRTRGPVGPSSFSAPFSPADYFGSLDVYLFGAFNLMDIIDEVSGMSGAPSLLTQALEEGEAFLQDVARLHAALPGGELAELDAVLSLLDPGPPDPAQLVTALNTLSGAIGGLVTQLSVPGGVALLEGERLVAFKLAVAVQGALASGVVAAVTDFLGGIEKAKNLTANLEWRPTIKGDSGGFFVPHNPQGLVLAVEARGKDQPGKKAGVDLTASLEDFDLVLLGQSAKMLTLQFEKLQFRITDGKKPEIDVIFKDIGFDGILAFVETLSKILPAAGFSDPPDVQVSEEGIIGGFTLPIPNIAVGMFSLENMAIVAEFRVPFIGPPVSVYFGFCTREAPFLLTVSMLGGGGFFGITVSPNGVDLLEAAFEFGASLSVDFGVASGGVQVMAGIYFALELAGNQTDGKLTGYLRMRGEVQVLGLISASIELRLELEYQFASKKVIGRASIEIEVSLLCFNATVEVSAERKFSGANDDPTLEQLMSQDDWNEYAAAFAA